MTSREGMEQGKFFFHQTFHTDYCTTQGSFVHIRSLATFACTSPMRTRRHRHSLVRYSVKQRSTYPPRSGRRWDIFFHLYNLPCFDYSLCTRLLANPRSHRKSHEVFHWICPTMRIQNCLHHFYLTPRINSSTFYNGQKTELMALRSLRWFCELSMKLNPEKNYQIQPGRKIRTIFVLSREIVWIQSSEWNKYWNSGNSTKKQLTSMLKKSVENRLTLKH